MRTLCVACHADVTAAQCAERCLIRANAKRELKAAINELKYQKKPDEIDSNQEVFLLESTFNISSFFIMFLCLGYVSYEWFQEHQQFETQDDLAEKELLVEVPGSAYSGAKANNSMENQEQENR